ncbi:oligosaccharide flippase family protein [Pedobacter aquatilis]|uniref:oligosaccharide flippase family protein n=1 Tax=Pedobacter aquatilis TaxID=351343 RepID=UPI0025B5F8F0|nr:oligosaccharide flippase family protein [Pedobacter aquatilis]MDN3587263.1 oligosaccharide flippase family protein [Pedobacter aquatilis]
MNLSSIQISNTLLILLIYPIITRIVGIENFGMVMLANTFSGLSSIIINYGTNQSGVRDIATYAKNKTELNKVFSNTIWVRILIFITYLFVLFLLQRAQIKYYAFIILSTPIVLAEVLNPLFFFLGAEKLKIYNIANLISKVVIILAVIVFIKGAEDAEWVNFIIGLASTATYAILLFILIKNYQLNFQLPDKKGLSNIAKDNFFLTINNISVHLQQSLMVFALAKWGTPLWLGAYSLCDKVISSSRILIISVSNAIYPKAAQIFAESTEAWKTYKSKMSKLIAAMFLLLSLTLFIMPGFIVQLLSGAHNQDAINFLRLMAFVPFLAALNVLNVLDLLLKNNTLAIFRIAIVLFFISAITAWTLVTNGLHNWFGLYTVLIDGCALIMYEYAIKKSNTFNA